MNRSSDIQRGDSVCLQSYSCCDRFRRSNQLVIVVNFLAMMTGIMVVSVLQPILPDFLDVMYIQSYLPKLHDSNSILTSNSTPQVNNTTFNNKPFIIGSLLGFAPLIEIFFTPVAVCTVNCMGFKKTMIFACVLQLFGCYAIAYANCLYLLYAARVTQAISVIFSTVAGFSMIAIRFRRDEERSNALATAMHSFPIGILLAYPAGTAVYHYMGVAMPFIIISVIGIIGGLLLLLIEETPLDNEYLHHDGPTASYAEILSDKAVLLSLMLLSYAWFVVFLLGATTPNRMASSLHAESWQIGLVLFVATLIQVGTSAIVGKLAGRVNRWCITLLGNLVSVSGLIAYPWCSTIYHTIGPETCVRIGWGFVNASMGPLLGTLVDKSHGSALIRVYALFMSFNLFGAFSGSLLGGWLEGIIGFDLLYWGCGVITLLVAILGQSLSCCLPKETEQNEVDETDIVPEYCPILDSRSPSPRVTRSLSLSYRMGYA